MPRPKADTLQVLVGINIPDPERPGKELRFEPGQRVPIALLRPETLEAWVSQGVVGIGE
jgi:hypothetical protein